MVLVREHPVLEGKEHAAGIHEVDAGEPVLQGDLLSPAVLEHGLGIIGSSLDRGVVGHDQDLSAVHPAHARDHAGARSLIVVHAVGGQNGKFQEGRVSVEELVQPLPFVADQPLHRGRVLP